MGYIITGQGSAYLDEHLGEESTNKQQIKTRLLTFLERTPGMGFTELMEHIDRQRSQIEVDERGWAPKGSQGSYKHALEEIVEEGLVEDVDSY